MISIVSVTLVGSDHILGILGRIVRCGLDNLVDLSLELSDHSDDVFDLVMYRMAHVCGSSGFTLVVSFSTCGFCYCLLENKIRAVSNATCIIILVHITQQNVFSRSVPI